MARRRSSGTLTVEVEIDQLLNDLSDDDILQEVAARDLGPKTLPGFDMLEPVRTALMRNKPNEALALLDAIMFPRFKSPDDAAKKLQAHLFASRGGAPANG